MSRCAVYVSNAGSGELSVLCLDEDAGTIHPVQTIALGGRLMPMALSPDRSRIHVVRRSEPLAAITLAIDATSGRLEPLGEAALPASMAHAATDASGRWLLCASYDDGLVTVSPIDETGRVGPLHQMLPAGRNAHALRTTPDNRFAFSTSLGSDRLLQYRFDAPSGMLAPNRPDAIAVHAGAGPRHLAFHPSLPRVYLLDELDATLVVLALDADSGTLSPLQTLPTLPPGFTGSPWAAELRLTPDGAFLYASERRSSTLAGFAVDATSGLLEPVGRWPTQAQPRGFAVAPSGRHLVVAGQVSMRVGVHAIDPLRGTLTALGELSVGQDPNWVETMPLA